MCQQRFCCREKPNGVGQSRVQFQRSFIRPFRMDREYEWFSQRLKDIDSQTTNFGTGRFINSKQLIA